MKKCPYCGQEYSNEVSLCPVDKEALATLDPPPSEPPSANVFAAPQLGSRPEMSVETRLRSVLTAAVVTRNWQKSFFAAVSRSGPVMRRVTGVMWIVWGLVIVGALCLRLGPWKQFYWEPFFIGLSAMGVGLGLLLWRSWWAHVPSAVPGVALLILGPPVFLFGLALGESRPGIMAGWILTFGLAGCAVLAAWLERTSPKTEAEPVTTRLPPFHAFLFWISISLGLVFVLFLLVGRASGPPDGYGEVLRALFLISPLALSTLAAIVLAILTAWRWRNLSRLQRWCGLLPLTLPVIIWSLSLAR